MKFQKLAEDNQKNKKIDANLSLWLTQIGSTWTVIGAPLIVGLLVNDLYLNKEVSPLRWTFYIGCLVIHIIISSILFYSGTKKSLSYEIDAALEDNKKYEEILLPRALETYKNSRIQNLVIYTMTLELEKSIDEMNQWPKNYPAQEKWKYWDEALERMLYPLARYRVELFGYRGEDMYNICLYMYNIEQDLLDIKWRIHDNRLKVSNRQWAPGHGHVGLTYIQDELKICKDIFESTELSLSSSLPEDKKNYRSFLSIPISDTAKLKGGGNPIGVLAFTSSAIGQFSESRDKIFSLTVAKILSIFIDESTKAG